MAGCGGKAETDAAISAGQERLLAQARTAAQARAEGAQAPHEDAQQQGAEAAAGNQAAADQAAAMTGAAPPLPAAGLDEAPVIPAEPPPQN